MNGLRSWPDGHASALKQVEKAKRSTGCNRLSMECQSLGRLAYGTLQSESVKRRCWCRLGTGCRNLDQQVRMGKWCPHDVLSRPGQVTGSILSELPALPTSTEGPSAARWRKNMDLADP